MRKKTKILFLITVFSLSVFFVQTTRAAVIQKANSFLGLSFSLVGYWTFDGGDMTATTARDRSGNGNTGTLSGTTRAAGKIGQGLSFDGVDDTINAGDVASVDTATDLSGCAWVKHNTITGDNVILAKNNSGTDGFQFFRDDTGASSGRTDTYTISVFDSADTDSSSLEGATNASLLQSGTMTYVCFTFMAASGTGLRLYVNGVEDANSPVSTSAVGAINAGANVLRIGTLSDGTTSPFDGLLDDVRVYTRVLTSSEITRLYQMGLASKVNTSNKDSTNPFNAGLVGYWTFDGGDMTATTTRDRSGNGNTGTLSGTTRAAGKIGQGLSFDGVDDTINAGSASSLDDIESQGGGGMSVSFWINPASNVSRNIMGKTRQATGSGYWTIQKTSATNPARLQFSKEGNTVDSFISYNSTLTIGVWQHIVITWNGSPTFSTGVTTYKNGTLLTRTAVTDGDPVNSDAAGIFCLGGSSNTPENACSGGTYGDMQLDEVRVYNRILSAVEVGQLYLMGK